MALTDPEFLAMRRATNLFKDLTPSQIRRVLHYLQDRYSNLGGEFAAKFNGMSTARDADDSPAARQQLTL